MSCDICGSSSCCASFHTIEEQERYSAVIDLFDKAREARRLLQEQDDEEEDDPNHD